MLLARVFNGIGTGILNAVTPVSRFRGILQPALLNTEP